MTLAASAGGRLGLRGQLRWLWRRLRGGELTPRRAAASVAVGLFIGCTPLYGAHLALCAALCAALRLDLVVAGVASNISNPLFAPFLVTAEIELGSLIVEGRLTVFDLERARAKGIGGFVLEAAVGSLVLGGALAGLGAAFAWWFASARAARRARAG